MARIGVGVVCKKIEKQIFWRIYKNNVNQLQKSTTTRKTMVSDKKKEQAKFVAGLAADLAGLVSGSIPLHTLNRRRMKKYPFEHSSNSALLGN